MEFFTQLLSSDFMPHGHCFMWLPEILWMRVISDATVATAYFAIPFALVYFIRRRNDMVFPSLFILFGLFIALCGLTHVLGIYTVWVPIYRLESVVKALTAIVSVATAIALVYYLPDALKLPSPTQMRKELEERRLVELELADAQMEERRLVEQDRFFRMSLNIICICSMEGHFRRLNPAWGTLLGYSDEELMAAPFIDFIHPDDRQDSMDQFVTMINGGSCESFENRFRHKDGTYRWILWSAVIAESEIYATGQDITQMKTSTLKLIEAKQMAEAASQSKSAFLATMSHELRTPLNAIIGFSEMLEDQTFGPLNERQARYMASIISSSRHLLQLINDILDLSKIEVGKEDLHVERLDPNAVLKGIGALVQGLAHKKEITLALELDEDLPFFDADMAKFKQIMYNLLSNAIKFTPEKGRVSVSGRQCDEGIEISVSDSGIGISSEDMERIFNSFEQIDSSYGRQQEGTGLGLALTRRLIELHNGRIRVESSGSGQGTTFTFVLPMSHDPVVHANNELEINQNA